MKEKQAITVQTGGWQEAAACSLAFLVPLIAYLRTMAPTVWGVDSAELATGAYLLGIVHPPGSPLFLLVAHLFTWLPIGDVGYRVNLLSAFSAALTVLFVYRILVRLTGERWVALTASWLLAFTYYQWVSAVTTELYALHGCFTVGLLLLALRWRDEGGRAGFCIFWLLFGLGLGNHPTLALSGPGLLWLLMSAESRPWRQPRLLIEGAACALVGASVYLYLPLRHMADLPLNPARDYWMVDLTTIEGFWWMISAKLFSGHFFGVAVADLPAEFGRFLYQLFSSFLGLVSLLGLYGLSADFRERKPTQVALILLFVAPVVFYIPYAVDDKEFMLVPAHLIWGIATGLGASRLFRQLDWGGNGIKAAFGPAALGACAAVLLIMNFPFVDLSKDWSARERGEVLLRGFDANALFIASFPDARIVEYLEFVEQRRGDVRIVDQTFSPQVNILNLQREALRDGRPIYASACPGVRPGRTRCKFDEAFQFFRIEPRADFRRPTTVPDGKSEPDTRGEPSADLE